MTKDRNTTIDILKCIAIIMVVLGHCIQFGCGAEYCTEKGYYTSIIFKYIYSFHMPLFALISGYLFYYSVSKRNIIQILQNRVKGILIPILGWQMVINIFIALQRILRTHQIAEVLYLIKGYRGIINNMWFLWAMLVCSCIVIICHYAFKDNIISYIVAVLGTFFFYDYNMELWLWLLPFFIIGYLANKNIFWNIFSNKYSKWFAFIVIAVHIICVLLWKNDFYIYEKGRLCLLDDDNLIYGIYRNVFRIVSGISGSFVWVMIAHIASKYIVKNEKIISIVQLCSKYSIGIYVFSVYVLNDYLRRMTWLSYNLLYVIIETILVLAISLLFMSFVNRFKYSRLILLGGR